MGFSCGIVGLANVGKSTVFNCLTGGTAAVSDYPFCTIDPNIGLAKVPDKRLEKLNGLLKPEEIKPVLIEFVDIAGLVKGASHGEGLGNQFLSEIRRVDAIVHVVGCFRDGGTGSIDELTVANTELALADLETVERRLEKLSQLLKRKSGGTGSPVSPSEKVSFSPDEEKKMLIGVRDKLQSGIPLRSQGLKREDFEAGLWANLLTAKPVILVANVLEKKAGEKISELEEHAVHEKIPVIYISALIESELLGFSESEAEEFRKEMGMKESALDKLIAASFKTLELITFYTVVHRKVTAWAVVDGTSAKEAAGKVHSDMERSFIRAEVIPFEDFETCGDMKKAKENGFVRIEGKDYTVQDGDIIYFLH